MKQLRVAESTNTAVQHLQHCYKIPSPKPKGRNEIELLPYIYPPCLHNVNFTAKICITVQIDLLTLQTSDLLRIVRKIPVIVTIMFISESEHFHLGDVIVLKDRKSMFKETRTFDKRAAE